MKLVINIPCYNEEKTLALVLKDIPKKIPGISDIEVQIVDDGSTDKTVAVAKKFGVDRIITHKQNLGLGQSFKDGMEAALDSRCDIFVNTDADNQYPSSYIPELVKPIVDGRCDIVIGNRQPWKVTYFSATKRFFQYFGNRFVRWVLNTRVPDTVSGFRAYSKNALLRINVVTKFSYVLDTIAQAVNKGLKIGWIAIKTNPPTRKSRLFKSMWEHIIKSGINMCRLFYLYEPFKTFLLLAFVFWLPGIVLLVRWFFFYFDGYPGAHIQSLVISAILLITSALLFGFGIIGDSLKTSRMLTEELLYYKKKELYNGKH